MAWLDFWTPYGTSLSLSYLNLLVLDGEEHDDGQAAHDDALTDEEDGAEDPVEAGDARGVVGAGLAAGRALEALERLLQVVLAVLALRRK